MSVPIKRFDKGLWRSAALAALLVAGSGAISAEAAPARATEPTPKAAVGFGPDRALIDLAAPKPEAVRRVRVADRGDDEGVSWSNSFRSDSATTKTFIAKERTIKPMLGVDSVRNLRRAIALYEEIVNQGGWPKLKLIQAIGIGAEGRHVELLRRRLEIAGDIPAGITKRRDKFDIRLDAAVRRFQVRHGLKNDGMVGGKTLLALNVPASTRLRALKVNLKRAKKMAVGLGKKYVVVNVPAAQAETVEDGYVYSRHNVIAGMKERETPLVASRIHQLNFSPYWHVPVSIVEKDLLPELRKSWRLLERMNMRVYRGGYNGKEIDPRKIDWSTVKPDQYLFRQDPGGENAMASVKINFPNSHAVYMHDTPTKQLFGRAERFYSSGCVRIQKIDIVLEWLLRGQDGWNKRRIKRMADTEERKDVWLKNPVPMRFAYFTAWANADGSASFREDLYGWDTEFGGDEPIDFRTGPIRTSKAKPKRKKKPSELLASGGNSKSRQRTARASGTKTGAKPKKTAASDDVLGGLEADALQLGKFR